MKHDCFCESIFAEQSGGVVENKGAALKNKAKLAVRPMK